MNRLSAPRSDRTGRPLIAAVIGIMLVAALGGCARLGLHKPAQTPVTQQSGTESLRDRLNDGYTDLYSTADGLSKVDKIFDVKIESDDVQAVAEDVTGYSGRLASRLQGLTADFPALDLQRSIDPPIIAAAYDAQKKGTLKRFAPVVGESGAAFERGLLIRLLGGVDTQRYLAQTLAAREPDPALKKIMAGAARRYAALYDEIDALLKKRFYR